MNNIIEFCKNKYKILIPVMVVFVLLIALLFYYKEYKYDSYRNREEVDVYQYFGGVRTDYKAMISYNIKKIIVDIQAINKKVGYDSTPIYYSNEDKIIFPREMMIVFPLKDGKQYRLYKYASYSLEDDVYKLTNGNESGTFNHFFLFDSKGLYFFSDEVTIYIDEEEYLTLGANSYVNVVGGNTITYYDKENNKSEMVEVEGKKVMARNDNLDLCLTENYFNMFGKKILITPLDKLQELSME